ncbi:MAG TPA: cyclic nucleotide-binding domain-containing protein [Beijerinckiaceae bacterium]|nr:cyclic nucleotide-binding domain-containing protein [Beijerinckiaceae bacterium]
MRREDREEVARLPLFAGLGEKSLDRLLNGAFLQRFPAHVELIREGDPPDFLHMVVEGQVELFSRYRDRETTVSVIVPYDTFILAAVVLDHRYLKSARALAPCRILMLPAEAVRQAFDTDPVFARGIAQELAMAYRGLVQELKNQKLRTSLERLANWLVRRDQEAGGTGRFTLPFDKKVLAARLGMVPEVLSRTFATLQAYGVTVDGRSITLSDREALMNLARPSPLIDDPEV